MSTIRIVSPSRVQSQHDESELRQMWQQGLLQEGTLFWREGMTEWRPIHELFQEPMQARLSPTPPPLITSRHAYARDIGTLTKFLLALLWISLGMEVVSILSDSAELALLNRTYTEAEGSANDTRQGIVGLIYLSLFIITAITFLTWTYRAKQNCIAVGAHDMRFTPGWSVAYYFIPILNLFRPYQAMSEIWQVSQTPANWKTNKGSALLGWWWALWLISGILGRLSFRFAMRAESVEELIAATALSILTSVVGIPLCLVLIQLVKTIGRNQDSLVQMTRDRLTRSFLHA